MASGDENALLYPHQLRRRRLHGQDRPGHLSGADGSAGRPVPRLHPRRNRRLRRRRLCRTSRSARRGPNTLPPSAPTSATSRRNNGARSTRRKWTPPTGTRAFRACRRTASPWRTCSTTRVRAWSATRRIRPIFMCRCGSPSSAAPPGSTATPGSTTPAATSATPATTSRRSRPCRAAPRAGSTANTPSPTAYRPAGIASSTTSIISAAPRPSSGSRG